MRPLKTLILVLLVSTPAIWLQTLPAAQEETPDKPAEKKVESDPEQPKEEPKPADADKPAESKDDPQSQWEKLSARKKEIALELAGLRKKFQVATVEEQRRMQQEFQNLVNEYLLEIEPEMENLAANIYKSNPDDTDAAEFLIRKAWNRHDYPKVIELTDKLIAEGHLTSVVLNFGGSAHFAEHDFEKAVEILSQAKTRNMLAPRTGGKFIDAAKEYVELWKNEQAIREQEANASEGEQLPRVELQTSKGTILLELFENEAPNTVANFVSLVESEYYNGIKFHRVEPNFVIQAGDPRTGPNPPEDVNQDGPGYSIKCECFRDDARMHFAGSLSMALSGKDTGGSQFFITHLPTQHLNSDNETPYNHTVFGRVVDGLDVVRSVEKDDVIEKATVVRKRDHEYEPETTPDE